MELNSGFSKRCYYYSGDDQKETWEDANKACQKKYKQAELATIGGSIDHGRSYSYITSLKM